MFGPRSAAVTEPIEGASLVARTAVDSPANVVSTRELIEKAFRYQLEEKGFSMIEILSPCPTNWGMTPAEATTWLRKEMMDVYRLGIFKDSPQGKGN
jgi:2-oxoglutarate ferredoxin oxidoreductase subunit beta